MEDKRKIKRQREITKKEKGKTGGYEEKAKKWTEEQEGVGNIGRRKRMRKKREYRTKNEEKE